MEVIRLVQRIKLFVLQAEGPKFNLQNPHGKTRHGRPCLWSQCWEDRDKRTDQLDHPNEEPYAIKKPCLK